MAKHHGRTDVRWQPKVFKPWYTRDGERREVDDYAARVQYRGQRETVNLGTPNRTTAAGRARDFYVALVRSGWEAALAGVKPAVADDAGDQATVGEFLEELGAKAELRTKTFEGYAVAFRKIVGDIFEIEGGRERFDYQGGGRARWIAKINAVELAAITPGKVQEWKRSFLAKAGTSHSAQRTARISVNSLIRRAKSLFAAKTIRHLERVKLPGPLPFDGIEFEKRQSMRYRSSFDVSTLIEKARSELAAAQPEQFKIFLLAVMAGLRRNEIDKLEWSALRWKEGVIRLEATKWFHPKSEDSLGDVEVDAELMELFRGYRGRATGKFVVESKVAPRPEARFEHYRCQSHFEKLLAWLRKKGVRSKTPLHRAKDPQRISRASLRGDSIRV